MSLTYSTLEFILPMSSETLVFDDEQVSELPSLPVGKMEVTAMHPQGGLRRWTQAFVRDM